MAKQQPVVERRGPFVSRLVRYPGMGGWTFAPIPKRLVPPGRPGARRHSCDRAQTLVFHAAPSTTALTGVRPHGRVTAARIRGRKGHGDRVTVEFTFELEDDD